MSDEIVNLVDNLIVQVQLEKKERYDICGCASCKLRANDIEAWLNPDKVVKVPDDIYNEAINEAPCQDQAVATVSIHQVWLCHRCLRKASASSGRCPFCGTKGLF